MTPKLWPAGATLADALTETVKLTDVVIGKLLAVPDGLEARVYEAMRYSALAPGKRLRPFLVLAGAQLFAVGERSALQVAAAIEMVHAYSLIHDDLPAMDNDDLRRGKPTSHKVFGEAIAILAGDALLTRAFHLMAEGTEGMDPERLRRRIAATALLGEACGTSGLIGGQVEDLESEGRKVNPPTLERLHRAKTGALLSACVVGGGILAGASRDHLSRLARYASAIGLAFQIVDDVLDETEGAKQLGKTAGKDSAAHKATYVSVHGLDQAREMAKGLHREAQDAILPLGGRADLLLGLAELIVTRRA